MSHTDKTRPLWVRMWDPADLAVGMREVHRHDGERVCDIPTSRDDYCEETSYDGNCGVYPLWMGVGWCRKPCCRVLDDDRPPRSAQHEANRSAVREYNTFGEILSD